MMVRRYIALGPLLAVVAMPAGCTQILDLDRDYALGGGGSGGMPGSSSSNSSSASGPTGECEPETARCSGNATQPCGSDGQWQGEEACPAEASMCSEGSCKPPPSCSGAPGAGNDCASKNGSCCESARVIGDTYDRSNDPTFPATVSTFRLDRFEITVGRFRRYVDAYPASIPAAGAGAHPLVPNSGWNQAWDFNLPADQAALRAALKCDATFGTWTDEAGDGERKPVNCISWYDAFAFCIWDGGRLATEAEWNYAAAGGVEQRTYPWGPAIDPPFAAYHCSGDGSAPGSCAASDILTVGSFSPTGDGAWGQADLAGNLWEWTLDQYIDPYPEPCTDCAVLDSSSYRVIRGGGFIDTEPSLSSSIRGYDTPGGRYPTIGARCARQP